MIIRAITISKQNVIDKYTVYFYDGSCLTLCSNPDSPQGISQWGEYFGINDADFEEAIENNNQLYRPENIMLIKYINVIRPGNYTIAIVTTNEKIDVGTTLSDIPGHEAIHIITVTVPPPSKTDIHIVSPITTLLSLIPEKIFWEQRLHF